jgi:hypothetical protein
MTIKEYGGLGKIERWLTKKMRKVLAKRKGC